MDRSDGRDSWAPNSDADWTAEEGDPADEWVLDPATGEYRLRLPGERPPHPARGADRPAADGAFTGTGLEPPRSPAESGAEPEPRSSRSAARGTDRRTRRGGRRRGSAAGGFKLAGAVGAIGLLGCATGGYLLLHNSGSAAKSCSAAPHSTAPASAGAGTPGDTATPLPPGPSAEPINVRVTILDGSGVFGQAEDVLSWMQNKQGYLRTSNGGATKVTATTSLVYAPDHIDQARTLAAAMDLPPSALRGTGKGTGLRDPMILTLGKDFTGAGKPLAPAVAPTQSAVTPVGCPN